MQNYLRDEVPIAKILLVFQSAENQQIVLIHERFCVRDKKINSFYFLKRNP